MKQMDEFYDGQLSYERMVEWVRSVLYSMQVECQTVRAKVEVINKSIKCEKYS